MSNLVIWVCVDCFMVRETGENPDSATVWSNGSASWNVSPGVDCGMPDHWEENPDAHAEQCETQDFSWSPCNACDSPLGGSRHAYTVFD